MKQIKNFFYKNRYLLGYTVGAVNLLAALNFAILGNPGLAVLWFVIGGYIMYDVHAMSKKL